MQRQMRQVLSGRQTADGGPPIPDKTFELQEPRSAVGRLPSQKPLLR